MVIEELIHDTIEFIFEQLSIFFNRKFKFFYFLRKNKILFYLRTTLNELNH